MKRLYFYTLLISILWAAIAFGSSGDSAEGIRWVAFKQGVAQSKATGKPMVIYFYSETCPSCTEMQKTTWKDNRVIETLNTRYTPVRVDVNKAQQIAAMYKVYYLPTTWFVKPDGELCHYDKRHLFAYGGENRRYTAGTRRVILDYLGWRINLQVCYDLRFPAWCRNRGDYDLMLLVANWPARRIHHWSTLLEARAIENQSWVVGVNRVGADANGLVYPGASVVHDPMGETVLKMGDGDACRSVELDLEAVERTRSRFPFQEDADKYTLD